MQYSFDETADKGVKVFELTRAGVQGLKDVPLTKGKKLLRLEAESAQSAKTLLAQYPEALVEMKLLLTAPLTSGDTAALAKYENLVSLVTELRGEEGLEFETRKGLSDAELFDSYYRSTYQAEPKQPLKELFLSTLQELER